MENIKQNLSLDRKATYQIKVPGVLHQRWIDMNDDFGVVAGTDEDGFPVTMLIVTVDQAALQGLLRRLYSLGLPLISVKYLNPKQGECHKLTTI